MHSRSYSFRLFGLWLATTVLACAADTKAIAWIDWSDDLFVHAHSGI